MAAKKGRAWKLERASVESPAKSRSRSNKYSRSDDDEQPPARSRERVWVGGYVRSDGRKVKGYYRATPGA
jgi:hypothetical protein